MDVSVQDSSLRISLYRTVPGSEHVIAESLRMRHGGRGRPFAILKAFGAFDIVLISQSEDFSHAREVRDPIPGVLNENHINCFAYGGGDVANAIEMANQRSFGVLTLLKQDPWPKTWTNYWMRKSRLLKSIRRAGAGTTSEVFGTLGWYEMASLASSDSITDLVDHAFTQVFQGQQRMLIKSYSILMLRFEAVNALEAEARAEGSSGSGILGTLDVPVAPLDTRIVMAVDARSTRELRTFWNDRDFSCSYLVGREDIEIRTTTNTTWLELLRGLLEFRRRFTGQILYTHINVGKRATGRKRASNGVAPDHLTRMVTYARQAPAGYETCFGKDASDRLLDTLDHLTALSSDPVTGDAFQDLLPFRDFLDKEVKEHAASGKGIRHLGYSATDSLLKGLTLRMCGTHQTTGELTSRHPTLSNGVHRNLRAIQYLVSAIFENRFGTRWPGFVSIGPVFSTDDRVINVPLACITSPKDYWGLYHEIGHVFIAHNPQWISLDSEPVRRLVEEHKGALGDALINGILRFLMEAAAEVIGFQLGFYGDVDEFMRCAWNYFGKIFSGRDAALQPYVMRTFCVEMFHHIFRSPDKANVWRNFGSNMDDAHDFLYGRMKAHIDKVEKITGKRLGDDFFVCDNIRFLHNVIFVLQGLNRFLTDKFDLPKIRELDDRNTRLVFDSIHQGNVWTGKIRYQEAILYHCLKMEQDMTVPQAISLVLTFWYAGTKKIAEGIHVAR